MRETKSERRPRTRAGCSVEGIAGRTCTHGGAKAAGGARWAGRARRVTGVAVRVLAANWYARRYKRKPVRNDG